MVIFYLADNIRANPEITAFLSKAAGVFLIGFDLTLAASK